MPSVAPAWPGTIVGVGLNYLPDAAALAARPTELPAIFFKGGDTVISPGDPIPLPPMSQRATAEAGLGLVIGRRMYQVTASETLDYVAGGCCVLDQTAEDVLRLDPRMFDRVEELGPRRHSRMPHHRPPAASQPGRPRDALTCTERSTQQQKMELEIT